MFEKEAEEYYNGQYDAWLEGEESYALEEERRVNRNEQI